MLPYARQSIIDEDVAAVAAALRSDWLTTGPRVPAFEEALAAFAGARHAVAFSSGTAALHGAAVAAGLGPGRRGGHDADDVRRDGERRPVRRRRRRASPTSTLRPADRSRSGRGRGHAADAGLLAVDYAGQPADYDALRAIAERRRAAR